jgi:hypothetical protein
LQGSWVVFCLDLMRCGTSINLRKPFLSQQDQLLRNLVCGFEGLIGPWLQIFERRMLIQKSPRCEHTTMLSCCYSVVDMHITNSSLLDWRQGVNELDELSFKM